LFDRKQGDADLEFLASLLDLGNGIGGCPRRVRQQYCRWGSSIRDHRLL